MNSLRPATVKKDRTLRARSYAEEAKLQTRTKTIFAKVVNTEKKSIKERIKEAIKSVKTSIVGKKNKSELVSAVEDAVSKNLDKLEEKVLEDVKKIENKKSNISSTDKNTDYSYKIDDKIKELVINLNKALEYTEHTRALFGQKPEEKKELKELKELKKENVLVPETVIIAKKSLTEEEKQDILFEKVNKVIEVLATYLVDDKGKYMLKFSKSNDIPVKYTLSIIGLGIDINYSTFKDLLNIISSRIKAIIILCFFGCNDNVKKALNNFKKTYYAKILDIKQLYLDFLIIISSHIIDNKKIKFKINDKITNEIPTEILTLLSDTSGGGKKRKPKKTATKKSSKSKKRKTYKFLAIRE
jgi:hypothetical protein